MIHNKKMLHVAVNTERRQLNQLRLRDLDCF